MFIAYLLRKAGYSVLVNNFRDHCYSGNSTAHMIEWGHAYPYDLLGAWDYAKTINWPLPASKVGILGISLGGFTTLNALGLESQIPAVWIDSAPYTPRGGFELGFIKGVKDAGLPGFMAGLFANSAWAAVEKTALAHGIDVNENLPEQVLPQGPDTQRKVFVTANKQDKTVAFSNAENIEHLLKTYPAKYDLVNFWVLDGDCVGETHATDMMMHSDEYGSKLKSFWDCAFGLAGQESCQAAALPTAPARLHEEYGQLSKAAPSLWWTAAGLAGCALLASAVGVVVRARSSQSRRVTRRLPLADDEAQLINAEG